MNGEMRKQWNITQPLKRKELLAHATAWMNPKDITLNDISQSQKNKPRIPKIVTFIQTEGRRFATGQGEGGMGSSCLPSVEFQFCKMNTVQARGMDGGNGCATM